VSDGYLIAPTEPATLRNALGCPAFSSIPETFGADILFPHKSGFVGVQRKEINDLIASVHDGRLGKELVQLERCSVAMLVVEGRPKWTTDGILLRSHGAPWHRTTHRSVLLTIQSKHVMVQESDSISDTATVIQHLRKWMEKGVDGHGFRHRPGPVSMWGHADNQDWAEHLLQGFEGVGPGVAKKIIEKFGGPPLRWDVTEEELMTVDGVGVKRARRLMQALETGAA
jgi:ERCC4-type nuclease